MENSKSMLPLVTSMVLVFITVILGILLIPAFEGIVVNRTPEKVLVYGDHPLILIQTITFITIGVSLAINVVNVVMFKQLDFKRLGTILTLIGTFILVVFFIAMLFVYPVKVGDLNIDRFNSYAWSLSLAGMIITLGIWLVWLFGLLSQQQEQPMTIKLISEGAISVGLAVVLSILSDIIGLKMPNGGSFSLSMLPLFIFALRRGIISGSLVGLTYGIINFLVDGLIIHWGSIFFDYLIPFTLLAAVAGIYMKKANNGLIGFSVLAVLLGGFMRYLFHGLSGMIFFAQWAPEGMSAFYYSFIWYNLPYMAVSTAGALLFVLMLHKRLITLDTRIV